MSFDGLTLVMNVAINDVQDGNTTQLVIERGCSTMRARLDPGPRLLPERIEPFADAVHGNGREAGHRALEGSGGLEGAWPGTALGHVLQSAERSAVCRKDRGCSLFVSQPV